MSPCRDDPNFACVYSVKEGMQWCDPKLGGNAYLAVNGANVQDAITPPAPTSSSALATTSSTPDFGQPPMPTTTSSAPPAVTDPQFTTILPSNAATSSSTAFTPLTTSTVTVTPVVTVVTPEGASSSSSQSEATSSTDIVAIALAGAAGALLLIAAIAGLVYYCRRKKARRGVLPMHAAGRKSSVNSANTIEGGVIGDGDFYSQEFNGATFAEPMVAMDPPAKRAKAGQLIDLSDAEEGAGLAAAGVGAGALAGAAVLAASNQNSPTASTQSRDLPTAPMSPVAAGDGTGVVAPSNGGMRTVVLSCPHVKPDDYVIMSGEGEALGDWDVDKAPKMIRNPRDPSKFAFTLPNPDRPIMFKFGKVSTGTSALGADDGGAGSGSDTPLSPSTNGRKAVTWMAGENLVLDPAENWDEDEDDEEIDFYTWE